VELTGPFALAPGAPVTLNPPPGHATVAVLLNNQSPFTCSVVSDRPGEWLQPWESHVYPVAPGAIPVVTALASPLTPGAGSLLASWISPIDTLTGVYPASLTGSAIIGSFPPLVVPNVLPVQYTTRVLHNAPLAGGGTVNVPIGPNDLAIIVKNVIIGGAHDTFVCRVTGHDSGALYSPALYVTPTRVDACEVIPAIDNSVDLFVWVPGLTGTGGLVVIGTSVMPQIAQPPIDVLAANVVGPGTATVIADSQGRCYRLLAVHWSVASTAQNSWALDFDAVPFGRSGVRILYGASPATVGLAGFVTFDPGIIFGFTIAQTMVLSATVAGQVVSVGAHVQFL